MPTIKINAPDQNPPTMSDFRDTPTTSSLSGTNSPTQWINIVGQSKTNSFEFSLSEADPRGRIEKRYICKKNSASFLKSV